MIKSLYGPLQAVASASNSERLSIWPSRRPCPPVGAFSSAAYFDGYPPVQTAGGECSPWRIESTLRILADDWELVVAAKGQRDE